MNGLRHWLNRTWVDVQIRRQRRHAYRDRVLVVSNHWDGSVQVFYHFLLGYFAPLTVWLRRTGEKRIAVRDCGPMNIWFDLLAKEIDVQVVKPGVALHSLAGNRSRHHVVLGLDYPDRHTTRKLHAAIEAMRSFADEDGGLGAPILVIDRQTSDDFHSGPQSETEMSGARRRSIPNLPEICGQLLSSDNYTIVDMANMPPSDQISLAAQANTLIAQHGAGLVHMIWMPAGSTIIEIHPPLPDEAIDVFRHLAKALGHQYMTVPQSDVHAAIDPSALQSVLAHALKKQ